MSSMTLLKQFDPAQLWRFFVDGRYQKKYKGWVGYEAGEHGSIQALINGFAFMLENIDLSQGLKATYLRELHKVCMLSVETTNLKSSPGDIRYLNSGMPFFSKTTTKEHLVEVFEMRQDDGTAIFNSQKYGKTANELDVDEIYQVIKKEGKINYRHWYPNLDKKQQQAIEGKLSLHEFYEAKHSVQMMLVSKMEEIVERYNTNIKLAKTEDEKLQTICLVSREMELLHPFPDGNCRTFSCITLLHLLLSNDFTPALLENPNLDNEVSLSQWIDEVKQGMERTKRLLANPEKVIFNYSILDMSQDDKEKFLSMSVDLRKKITDYKEIYLTPALIEKYTQGKWLGQEPNKQFRFSGVGTYGTYQKGNVYFSMAINDWIKEKKDPKIELKRVINKGIVALVLDDLQYAKDLDIPILMVKDSFQAFKQCAIKVRQEHNPYTVLVTGTEGKTGAKVQLHHLLNQQVKTHAVLNSANTEVPVLRSLINLEVDDKVEINEVSVGSDEAYRVERTMMVSPNLCLFTNIGPNHMDMHKSIENLLDAKSSVVEGLKKNGICIINAANEYFADLVMAIKRRKPDIHIETYGIEKDNMAYLIAADYDTNNLGWKVKASIDGDIIDYILPLCQQHAPLASVGILLTIKRMGYDIHQAAQNYNSLKPYHTMGKIKKLYKPDGEVLFYDQSRRGGINGMRSAFNDLNNFKIKGKFVALVGGISIKKDSDWTRQAHTELAEFINKSPISRLYTTGNYMTYVRDKLKNKSIFVKHSDDLDELAKDIMSELEPEDCLFIIGSAYLYLGRLSEKLLNYQFDNGFNKRLDKISFVELTRLKYNVLMVFHDKEKGGNLDSILNLYHISRGEFQQWEKQYKNFSHYRATLLMGFFNQLEKLLLNDFNFQCINQEIKDSGYQNAIINLDFCQRWFNNFDKIKSINSKQLIGSFFDFGHEKYFFHIEVATSNLHIGFVKYEQEGTKYKLYKMEKSDQEALLNDFSAIDNLAFPLLLRKWGFGCLSVDCQSFIDMIQKDIYAAINDVKQSELYIRKILPLLNIILKNSLE